MSGLLEALARLEPLAWSRIEAEWLEIQHRIAPVTFEAPRCDLDLTCDGVRLPTVNDGALFSPPPQ